MRPDSVSGRVTFGRAGGARYRIARQTCAAHLFERGADTRILQQLSRHTKLETTPIYTEGSIKLLQDVHERTHPAG